MPDRKPSDDPADVLHSYFGDYWAPMSEREVRGMGSPLDRLGKEYPAPEKGWMDFFRSLITPPGQEDQKQPDFQYHVVQVQAKPAEGDVPTITPETRAMRNPLRPRQPIGSLQRRLDEEALMRQEEQQMLKSPNQLRREGY